MTRKPSRRRTSAGGTSSDEVAAEERDRANAALSRFADRLEALAIERGANAEAQREVLKQAAEAGYHKGALRQIVKRRLETEQKRASRQATEEAFAAMQVALGELADTPLGEAALEFGKRFDA